MPCRTIQYAINTALSGDSILLAAGTYGFAAGISQNQLCKTYNTKECVACVVNKHLTIKGGYSTSNWTNPNPTDNLTILDGSGQYRVIALLGTNTVNPAASLIIEGVTIQNGLAQGGNSSDQVASSGYGGGIYAQNAPLTMSNIIVRNNRAIGGNNSSNSNGGVGVGGGLAVTGLPVNSIITMNHVTFDSNSSQGGTVKDRGAASFGGGIYTYSARIDITDLILNNNLTQAGSTTTGSGSNNGTADALGGGAAFHINTNATIHNLIVTNNRAIGGNAVVQGGNANGGGLFAELATNIAIYDADIRQNSVVAGNAQQGGLGGGGGVMMTDSWLTLGQSYVVANSAKGGIGTTLKGSACGGGLMLGHSRGDLPKSKAVISNSIIADNLIELNTGAGDPGGGGGGLWIHGLDVDINHSTIDNNRMGSNLVYGSAAILVNFSTPYPSNVNLNYTAVTNHISSRTNPTQSTFHIWSGNALTLNKGLFWGNSNDINAENDPASPGGPGNIVGLASMITGKAANYIASGAPIYNYHLALNSNAKDQATGSTTQQDIDIENRPYGDAADIGMDEYTPFNIHATPFDGGIYVDWSQAANSILAGGVARYSITVTCAPGANPPNGIACNTPTNIGSVTSITLSGLTNFKPYGISLSAYNGNGTNVANSMQASASPTNLFSYIYIPVIRR